MDEIKEQLNIALKIQKDIEFLQDFENNKADSFVTREEVLKLFRLLVMVYEKKMQEYA